jgi:hypothetical protein
MQHPGDTYNILDTETGTVQRLVMDEEARFQAWYIQHNQEGEFTETLLGAFDTTKAAFEALLRRYRAN